MSNYQKTMSDFLANLSKGVADSNRYWVEFTLPAGVSGSDNGQVNPNSRSGTINQKNNEMNSNGSLSMMCQSTQIPGRTYMTFDVRYYPNSFKMPYSSQYDDISFIFTLSEDLKERKFFEIWQETIINNTTGTLNFYEEYISNIKIHHLNKKQESEYSIELVNAYPIALSPLDYSYANENQLQVASVTFTYQYWRNLAFDDGRFDDAPY